MAHQKSKKRMAERRAKRHRQSQIRLIVGIAIAAVVVVAVIVLLTWPRSPAPETGGPEGYGITAGEASASVTLIEYSDFSCPHCEDLAGTINELISKYASDGRLRVVYKPVSFINPTYSEPASRAAVCADKQGKGWQMIDYIWGLSSPELYSLANFTAINPDVGLDIASFTACFDSPEVAQTVQAVNDEALGKGINGTPTVFVNGIQVDYSQATSIAEAVTQAVEAALGG